MSYYPPHTISVTELRSKTREVIQKVMEGSGPVYILYNSQMPVCLLSTRALETLTGKKTSSENLKQYAGFLKNSKAFTEGALPYQHTIRTEWKPKQSRQ